jgi:hypothetical protein
MTGSVAGFIRWIVLPLGDDGGLHAAPILRNGTLPASEAVSRRITMILGGLHKADQPFLPCCLSLSDGGQPKKAT